MGFACDGASLARGFYRQTFAGLERRVSCRGSRVAAWLNADDDEIPRPVDLRVRGDDDHGGLPGEFRQHHAVAAAHAQRRARPAPSRAPRGRARRATGRSAEPSLRTRTSHPRPAPSGRASSASPARCSQNAREAVQRAAPDIRSACRRAAPARRPRRSRGGSGVSSTSVGAPVSQLRRSATYEAASVAAEPSPGTSSTATGRRSSRRSRPSAWACQNGKEPPAASTGSVASTPMPASSATAANPRGVVARDAAEGLHVAGAEGVEHVARDAQLPAQRLAVDLRRRRVGRGVGRVHLARRRRAVSSPAARRRHRPRPRRTRPRGSPARAARARAPRASPRARRPGSGSARRRWRARGWRARGARAPPAARSARAPRTSCSSTSAERVAARRVTEPEAARGGRPEPPQGGDLAVAQVPPALQAELRHLDEVAEEGDPRGADPRTHRRARGDGEERAAMAHVGEDARAPAAVEARGRPAEHERVRAGLVERSARRARECRQRAATPPRRRASGRRAPRSPRRSGRRRAGWARAASRPGRG